MTLNVSAFLNPGITQKHIKKMLKKQRPPMEAQRVKTRGPYPNPTAQAQSKRCLPLFTQTQNIIENVFISGSIFYQSGYFLLFVAPKLPKGSRARPKVVKSDENRPQLGPSGPQGCPNGAQVGPRGTQMEPQAPPKYRKTYPKPFQSATWTPKRTPKRL